MGKIEAVIREHLPDTYVYSVQLAPSDSEDQKAGFFGNVNMQVDTVCEQLRNDEHLKDGFNAIGFSQGGQFLRQGAYAGYVRDHVVQAQYYKDWQNLEAYLKNNIFLPDINNELPAKNSTYAKHLQRLHTFVMIQFDKDITVKPAGSAWFDYYNASGILVPLKDQPLYKEDWIGLMALDKQDRLVFKTCPGAHMQFTLDYFVEEVLWPYLADQQASTEKQVVFDI
ncbi:hypothetical protein BZG36_05227 [Bifiguratus adelaidae]|uniref:Palmitoyl-protein thioesterase 1 n=1 Tax=Bifiguratus adelaidae TaxID=1938954 RepID=A0A261XUM1_9FUNG|nr:hypothetical protein BZG36_05227 [Bifiguratus adelaidae]